MNRLARCFQPDRLMVNRTQSNTDFERKHERLHEKIISIEIEVWILSNFPHDTQKYD